MTDASDPFATLGVPRSYALAPESLAARHLELSRTLHPDRFVGSGGAERRMALGRAIEVNEAYRTLKDPIRRAEALLRLEGLGNEIGERHESASDPAFLMEVLEQQETLDEAKSRGDEAQVSAIAAAAQRTVLDTERLLLLALEAATALSGEARATQLRSAIPLLGRLRYAVRFRDEARSAQDTLSADAPL